MLEQIAKLKKNRGQTTIFAASCHPQGSSQQLVWSQKLDLSGHFLCREHPLNQQQSLNNMPEGRILGGVDNACVRSAQ
jgi:hypothetical protein